MLNAIYFFTMYPTIFLMYFILKGEGKVKHHTLFGIRFSSDWLSEEECTLLQMEYRRRMNRYLLIFALIPFITLPIPYFSISLTIWMLWLLAVIAAFMLPYILSNRKLLALKQERQPSSNLGDITYTEMKNAGTVRIIKRFDFALPLLLSVLLTVFSLVFLHNERFEMYSILVITFAACTPLFYICALWMDRLKTTVISNDSDVNVNFSRACKKIYKNFWQLCIWSNTLFTAVILGIALLKPYTDISVMNFILWGSIAYCLLLLVYCGYMWNQKLKLDRQYQNKMDLTNDNDEKFWIGGMFYYNPKDSHTIVSKKFGIGTTYNMATNTGKVMTLIGAVAILSIPILCIWVMLEEFTPISLTITGDHLTAHHTKTEYSIPLNTIEEVSVLEELPRSTKVTGTGMDALYKGTFRNSQDGKVQYFLNPQNEWFIRFVSEDTIYYMSGYDDTETMVIFEYLQQNLSF